MRRPLASRPTLLAALLLPLALAAALPRPLAEEALFRAGFATIEEKDVEAHLAVLASPRAEGRDTPSAGLAFATAYVVERFAAAGLEPLPDSIEAFRRVTGREPAADEPPAGTPPRAPDEAQAQARPDGPDSPGETPDTGGTGAEEAPATRARAGTFLRPFTRSLPQPDPAGSRLVLAPADAPEEIFELGVDFVPVAGCEGEAAGALVFLGYGIESKEEPYDDLGGERLSGKVALVLEGEPRHKRRFEGPEVTEEASLWRKLKGMERLGVEGVIVARRAPEPPKGSRGEPAPPVLGFRYTWAQFIGMRPLPQPKGLPPVVEVTTACASRLLGEDVEELARRIDRTARPARWEGEERPVRLASATRASEVRVDNVAGWIRGSDPALADEVVVVGAHVDHVGVDPRGRIGYGADDNASGTAALLEIAEALAAARPRRSVVLCAFAGEEDGLLGSRAFCAAPPFPAERLVAMVNLDMVGRGDAREVAVLGVKQNPELERVLDRAKRLKSTGVSKIVVRQGEELFERSDHFSFHSIGVPALFFFEGLPISRNEDYHTWRDTLDHVDGDKVARTSRLAFNTAWLLATDDDRPPPPR